MVNRIKGPDVPPFYDEMIAQFKKNPSQILVSEAQYNEIADWLAKKGKTLVDFMGIPVVVK